MQGSLAKRPDFWALVLLGIACHVTLSHLPREAFLTILIAYSGAFLSLMGIWKLLPTSRGFLIPILIGMAFRMVWFMEGPNFSDDYFRFFWDGNLIHENISPYDHKPEEIIDAGTIPLKRNVDKLYLEMNSPQYYSIYPPINQVFFWFSTLPGLQNLWVNITILRALLLIIEVLGIFFIARLWSNMDLKRGTLWLYWANPLLIMEGIGNLHFEVVSISFLGIGLYYFQKKKYYRLAVFWALAITTKLNPLVWLPMIKSQLSWSRFLTICLAVLALSLLILFPVFGKLRLGNFLESLDLYFHSFEFNASLYYLERALGFLISGYNNIAIIGSINALLSVLLILGIAWKYHDSNNFQDLLTGMLMIYSIYMAFSTTVHPWYAIPLIFLGMASNFYFPLIWSFTIILSYEAYGHAPVRENPWILTMEYIPVYIYAIYEFSKRLSKTKEATEL